MKKGKFDFGGWASKNDLLCADGRTIRKNAFKDDDGRTVPLVWQHNHEDPTRVIGHALLENRNEGVYAYCSFNNTDMGQHVKELVRHGDVNSLSIYANKLRQSGGDVLHGVIREVSVVLAGANPGAMIEFPMMAHGEESETEAKIFPGEENLELFDGGRLSHADDDEEEEEEEKKPASKAEPKKEEEKPGKDAKEETVQDVLDSMNDKQRKVVEYLVAQALGDEDDDEDDDSEEEDEDGEVSHADSDDNSGETVQDVMDSMSDKQRKVAEYLIAKALEEKEKAQKSASKSKKDDEDDEDEDEEDDVQHYDDEGEEFTMKKNVFENGAVNDQANDTLTHAQMDTLIKDANRLGSLKESVLQHSAEYGIDQIDYLMPEYREVNGGAPAFIRRENDWVTKVMQGVHHTPFSKVKTTFADITEEEARARGYIKGNLKKNEVFTLLKRTTRATTVYKKQKLDKDDASDITDFDVVAWLKTEMRSMLDEELARAFLIGDGRDTASDDHIDENSIRPVLRDSKLFVIRRTLTVKNGQAQADALVDAVTYAWEDYQGSGNCVAFMTRHQLAGLKLLKDKMGRRMYANETEIASALGVRELICVPAMGDTTTVRTENEKTYAPAIIILDLNDYNVGADKGGAVNMFDDFDIDYNQQKYLIETRCSGALVKPYSAIVIEEEVNAGGAVDEDLDPVDDDM